MSTNHLKDEQYIYRSVPNLGWKPQWRNPDDTESLTCDREVWVERYPAVEKGL